MANHVEEALEALKAGAAELGAAFDQVVESLNFVVLTIPAEVVAAIQNLLNEIRQALERIFDTLTELLKRHGPFSALILTSSEWVSAVMAPMRTMSDELSEKANEADDLIYWEGKARTKYEQKKKPQQETIREVSEAAKFISGWLMGIARKNVEWLNRLLRLEVEVGIQLVEAAKKARTDPEGAVAAALEVIKNLIKAAADELIGATERVLSAAEDKLTVQRHLAEVGVNNGWPQAVEG